MPTMPTPLPPPIIRTVCPGFILALPTSMCHDVMPTIETAAASSKETLSGILTTLTSGRCVYCAKAPQRGPVWKPQIVRSLQSYSLPEVHMSELQSRVDVSDAALCLKNKLVTLDTI